MNVFSFSQMYLGFWVCVTKIVAEVVIFFMVFLGYVVLKPLSHRQLTKP